MQRTACFWLALCLPHLALAHTIEGELRVHDDAVDVVTRTNTYRLVGRSDAERTRIDELSRYLRGERVTLEGRLFMSERGPYLVPAQVLAPVRTQIVASGSASAHRRELHWRGDAVPASGLDREVPDTSTRLDVFLFETGKRVDRVHVVGIRARSLPARKTGWIRHVEHDRHVAWIPLPPGNPTTLWDFTLDTISFSGDDGGDVSLPGALVSILPADPANPDQLLGATEVPEGQGIEDVLRRQP